MTRLRQFGLLLWKNYVLQKRQILVTIVEISLPLLFAAILIILRQRVNSVQYPNATTYPPFYIYDIPYFPQHPTAKWSLVYIPSNVTAVETIAKLVKDSLRRIVKIVGFQTEAQFNDFIRSENKSAEKILVALVIDHDFKHQDERLPLQVNYHLRFKYSPLNAPIGELSSFNPNQDKDWHTRFLFPLFQVPGPREQYFKDGGSPGYYREGFLATQLATDRAIIKYHASKEAAKLLPIFRVEMLRFPFPPYIDDVFILAIQTQLSLLVMLSFTYTALNVTKAIVLEKETKQKEYMKMMGLNNWLHWLAWFFKFLLFLIISIFLMTVLFCAKMSKHGAVLSNSDPTLVFAFLLLFSISTISFSFMISVFFSKANIAAAVSGFLYFFSYIPYFFITPRYHRMTHPQKVASCLISNVGMALGCQLIGMFEGKGVGVQWSNIFLPVSVDDSFTLAQSMAMLILDSVVYILVTWYVETVFPGEYGIPQVWYFFILPSYWFGKPRSEYIKINKEDEEAEKPLNTEYMEDDPLDIEAGIKIKDLTKIFKVGNEMKEVVSHLTINLYKGQISVLLGHNGAGKTTTLAMLTGLFPPTSGTANINGYDICQDMPLVRQSLGLCPQHDVLFDNLTVEEHLLFFSGLKGCRSGQIREEVNRMLSLLKFKDKRKAKIKTLSGGMKRKLSIGIALIGNSKVVMLDEPTSGMDPLSRRSAWDLLQNQKYGRTILLTTHFMDEADLLGDRILIMANGQLQCCGTSLFLKNKYGAGYHMVIVKQPHCKVANITALVKSLVPNAVLQTNAGAELSYILPSESTDRFEDLFSQLEMKKKKLGIASYGASITTMEEVFLKVGKLVDSSMDIQAIQLPAIQYQHERRMSDWSVGEKTSLSDLMDATDDSDHHLSHSYSSIKLNTGIILYLQQFYAMLMKRATYTWRNWKIFTAQFMVPLIFACFSLIVAKTFPGPQDSPPLNLTLEKYGPTNVPFSLRHVYQKLTKHLTQAYKEVVEAQLSTPIQVEDDIIDYLLNISIKEGGSFNEQCVVAADFHDTLTAGTTIRVLFNNLGYHTSATSLMLVDNALFKILVGPTASISTTNYPQPRNITEQALEQLNENRTGFALAFNVMYGMAFLASTFSLLLVSERTIKSKHIQVISGLHIINFWLSALLWDLINYMIPCVMILVMFQIFDLQPFTVQQHLGDVLILLLLYGWSIIPIMYLFHHLFTTIATAYTRITIINILTGTATFLAITIMNIPELDLTDLAKILDAVFLVLPNYCLGQAINDFYQNYQLIAVCTRSPLAEYLCKAFNITYQTDYFSWESPGVGRFIFALAVQGLVFLTFLLLIEFSFFKVLSNLFHYIVWRKRMASILNGSISQPVEDSDVRDERLRIEESTVSEMDYPLVIKDLLKIYRNESTLAVNRIFLAVNKGECFGLLGFNGAGKTTTFKMLTGDEKVSGGDAFIAGYSILKSRNKVRQKIGYCPQFDALLGHMTGRETLNLFARLRGIPEHMIQQSVDDQLQSFLLESHAQKLVRTYSGGNKRKLSTAVAMIGNPAVIFLDEPSTGMDPVSRRLLWDAVTRSLQDGKSIVITSHSMEECEALCTRLAVMVNGQFKCLGSPQHLKNKFGSGFTLLVKIHGDKPDLKPFKNFIETTFEGSILKDEHHGMVHYHLTSELLSWSQIFGTLERAKEKYNIKDYSVNQISLEQVFLSFARFQLGSEERPD
ncbi:phospholipid-transporting ATPase ABCA3 isoform X1 [Chiloscyllium plagiosum]|uniref:phospholipid-transporting ATPase ABCA3 isoform X1 n=1 Tax=Chiloscyllium plagiosum TaxID=36176 RepID=UPI001CB88484|nr:phospholipid-transporting ATPase ABCA3 isoform X1 [Chiloscyllium plagiosum]XP_043567484.1 phospholipid-transporting ATPase ABCA3 isoform X1 [Chiloscyllium plagiosum]